MELTANLLRIINQFFDIEKKSAQNSAVLRPLERIRNTFDEMGYRIHNPLGEKYNETRTDCEAGIVGSKLDNLVIVEVIKPIVHQNGLIIQKGVVIVESRP